MNAILVGKKPVIEKDVLKWARWFESADRHVAKHFKNGIRVSTVFLGIDHGFGDRPLWFETMIFGGDHDGYQERYETWEDAHAGHLKALVTAGLATEA